MEPIPVSSEQQIWKVKVPKFLAESIVEADAQGKQVGSMRIDADNNISLHFHQSSGSNIPKNYKMKITNEHVQNEYA